MRCAAKPLIASARSPTRSFYNSEQLAILPEKRMWPVELADRDLMGDDVPKSLPRPPDMQVKRRWLDPEGRFALLGQVEIDGVIGRGADRGGDAGKGR